MYRLYSWEHSYFSGKVRAYLRFKQRMGALEPGFEDVLATSELIRGRLLPRTQTGAIPQLETPDGTLIQDSSEIIDHCEAAHPLAPVVPDPDTHPRQCIAAHLIELFADEWLVVPAFWERWAYSRDGEALSHRGFNEQQWGAIFAAGAPGEARRRAGADFFEAAFGISDTRDNPRGVYAGLVHLGAGEDTESAWQASQHRVLQHLERHFAAHDFVLGGAPSLADFGLLGPLYAHLYRDAVSGFALRTHFPIVCEWVERTNGEGALNARAYDQKMYGLDADGELVPRAAHSDDGRFLADDAIATTLNPLLNAFFEEMWPVLESSADVLTRFIASADHVPGGELPGKTFTATPGFEAFQTGDGPLTHNFELDGTHGRRMVVPYQIWMLRRLASVIERCTRDAANRSSVGDWLKTFPSGHRLLELDDLLAGCRVHKRAALLFSDSATGTEAAPVVR